MTKSRKRKEVERQDGKPGSIIRELAAQLMGVDERGSDLEVEGSSRPQDKLRIHVLRKESKFLRTQILEQTPQSRADTGIIAMLCFEAFRNLVLDEQKLRFYEGDESMELIRCAYLRKIRFLMDDGTIDLGDPVIRWLAVDCLVDDYDLFPEIDWTKLPEREGAAA